MGSTVSVARPLAGYRSAHPPFFPPDPCPRHARPLHAGGFPRQPPPGDSGSSLPGARPLTPRSAAGSAGRRAPWGRGPVSRRTRRRPAPPARRPWRPHHRAGPAAALGGAPWRCPGAAPPAAETGTRRASLISSSPPGPAVLPSFLHPGRDPPCFPYSFLPSPSPGPAVLPSFLHPGRDPRCFLPSPCPGLPLLPSSCPGPAVLPSFIPSSRPGPALAARQEFRSIITPNYFRSRGKARQPRTSETSVLPAEHRGIWAAEAV